MRIQYFEPAFFFQHAHHVQRVVFVGQLGNFIAHRFVGDVLDVIVFFGGIKAGLGAFLQRPVKARGEAGGPDQPGGIFDKSVVMQNAEKLGFDISSAVERVHQQAARTRIQRQGHGIDGEIPAAQVFDEGGGRNYRRLAGFLVVLEARHADFGPNVAGQAQIQRLYVVIGAGNLHPGLLQVLLQFEGIALDREIEVADGKTADDVADRASGQVNVHTGGARDVLYQGDAALLVRRQPDFHGVNVISHACLRTRLRDPVCHSRERVFHRLRPGKAHYSGRFHVSDSIQ